MLAVLKEQPNTPEGWNRFAFHNNDQISRIQQAIRVQYGISLTSYILYPLNLEAPDQWLQNNQAAHTDFNAVLGLQSRDIQDVDFNDPEAVADWLDINYKELFDASTSLGV